MGNPMDETRAMELLGRTTLALTELQNEYAKILDVLGKVVSGEYPRENVTVDMVARVWTVQFPEAPPDVSPDAPPAE